MTTAWPSDIPQCPILNGFSEQRQRNLASFEPDVGPPKIRRRSTAVAVVTAVAFRMTIDQWGSFANFFENDLQDGSLPFEWAHPIFGTTYNWMFDSKDAPRIERMTPGTVRISFTLLRLP